MKNKARYGNDTDSIATIVEATIGFPTGYSN